MNFNRLNLSLFLFVISFSAFSQGNTYLTHITNVVNSEAPPQTVQQFLKRLPPNLLSQYTLQFHGFGLQKASQNNPRVFLFDAKEGIVLTYNNDPLHQQHNEIEILSYNKSKEEFELSEIIFKENESPQIISNPPLCLACHQSGYGTNAYIRPIFNSFNNWSGFFGGIPLNEDELKKEIAYIKKFNKKQKINNDSDLNRYSSLTKSFPLNHIKEKFINDRPNQQIMNLLMYYNSRSIQKSMSGKKIYKTILPWIGMFYFDEKVSGIDQFGEININSLEKKGCFVGNESNKNKLKKMISDVQDELRKNNAYFERSEAEKLTLLSLYEGMGYPRQSLSMSLGQDESKIFLIDEKVKSSIAVIPSFIIMDFFNEYLESDLSFKLIKRSAKDILSSQGIKTNSDYSEMLDEINPSHKIELEIEDENQCVIFYEKMIPVLEKSLSSRN